MERLRLTFRPGPLATHITVREVRMWPEVHIEKRLAINDEAALVRQVLEADHGGAVSSSREVLGLPARDRLVLRARVLGAGSLHTIYEVQDEADKSSFVLKLEAGSLTEDTSVVRREGLGQGFPHETAAEFYLMQQAYALLPESVARPLACGEVDGDVEPFPFYTQERIPPSFRAAEFSRRCEGGRIFLLLFEEGRRFPLANSPEQGVLLARQMIHDSVFLYGYGAGHGWRGLPSFPRYSDDIMVNLQGCAGAQLKWASLPPCFGGLPIREEKEKRAAFFAWLELLASPFWERGTGGCGNEYVRVACHLGIRGAYVEGAASAIRELGEPFFVDESQLHEIFDRKFLHNPGDLPDFYA